MKRLSKTIENTILKPQLTLNSIEKLVSTAVDFGFSGVCIPPYWVKYASRFLDKHSDLLNIVTVIGFPLGYNLSKVKALETELAIKDGASEIDMVMNLVAFRENAKGWVKPEIAQLAKICHDNGAALKVILETAYLTEEEIVFACKISQDAGADFVKTSTGFASEGAKVEHIRLMREAVGSDMGIKASGGIKNLEQALALIEAGADRLGTSSGVEIMKEWKERNQ